MGEDPFEGLARYYDPIMEHVDYERWFDVVYHFSRLLPDDKSFKHLDAGCGTGVLMEHFKNEGWDSIGIDLSGDMLHQAAIQNKLNKLVNADLTALPFTKSFDYVTCLFDTVNFLLTEEQIQKTLQGFFDVLEDGGLLYFDYVTERLVLEHFAGQEWREDNGKFETVWASEYDRKTKIAETHIRINTGREYILFERVYPDSFYLDCLRDAGFTVLGVVDAENGFTPSRRTCRIDVFAAKNPEKRQLNQFKKFKLTLQ